METIRLAGKKHRIADEYMGCSYEVDESFKEAKSHAGEVQMPCTYAPDSEYGNEGDFPYIAVQDDDAIYCAIEEFNESGVVENVLEFTRQSSDKFLFKAKVEYYGAYLMYFYAFDNIKDDLENAGLCVVYPKEYVGTENEKILMSVLDEVAESFEIEEE